MRKALITLGAALALGLGAAIAVASIPDGDGNFYACVANGAGTIRMIEKSVTCRSSETRVSWPAQQASLQIYRAGGGAGAFDPTSPIASSIASCDDGDPVTGGGFSFSGTNISIDDLAVLSSEPGHFQNHDEWQVSAIIDNPGLQVFAIARCLDLPPAHT
jgi:hypothetical protein